MLLTTFTTYITALFIEKVKQWENSKLWKTVCVVSGVVFNLFILAIFKYGNFIIDNVNQLFGGGYGQLSLVLPVGISFYTFQSMGYVIDVYRDEVEAEKNFAKYALFVSFFPQLVAGPIERSKNLLKQLYKGYSFDYTRARRGLLLMLWGLFQKIVICDRAAIIVNTVFENYELYNGSQLMFAAFCFAIQIYTDFAGYSNIAIGASEVLGIKLMENFNHPYFARNVKEFWNRWHISLSTWFKDYLYIPLGGNRCSKARRYCNLMITMVLSGLWHGANWTYIFWGALHGAYRICSDMTYSVRERVTNDILKINKKTTTYKFFQYIITFLLVDFAWIFFRAKSIKDALNYIFRMFTTFDIRCLLNDNFYMMGLDFREMNILISLLIGLLLVSVVQERIDIREWLVNQNTIFRWMIYLMAIILILFLGIYGDDYQQTQFIYFQF